MTGPQPPGWDRARYPNSVESPPSQSPSRRASAPPAGPPRRRRGRRVVPAVLLVAGIVVAAVVIVGVALAVSRSNGHKSAGSRSATPTDSGSGAGSGSAEQARTTIARNAETVVHGLGNGRPTEFCPLIDHADLSRLLREKHLGKCADIKLTVQTNHVAYRRFAVTDPSAIQINGDIADIPATAVTPATFGTVEMREDGDGTWKFRFFTG